MLAHAYLNGRYLPVDDITISPDDRGFLFADGIYEVIRSYDGRLFRAGEHMERLHEGARELLFDAAQIGDLAAVATALIRKNDLVRGDALVYIQITRGSAPRTHFFPPPGTPLTVFARADPFLPKTRDLEEGVHVVLASDRRWGRCDIKTTGLLPNVLARQHAREHGAEEAVFVRDGIIQEGTHSSFFAVFGGEVATPPKTNHILAGITRRAVLDICRTLSVPAAERPIRDSEIHRAQELMIVGTTVEVTPVVTVDDKIIGDGRPGPVTRKLQEAFRAFVTKHS